jgi:hypothetical protein
MQIRRSSSAMARNPNVRLAVGTIFLILAAASTASAEWKEKVLYSFQGGNDGYTPAGGVVFDKAGNLYGANSWGGSGGCPSPGCGTVFELSPPTQKGGAWTETTIYAFQGVLGSVKDGLTPEGGVIVDQQGNLYGTTSLGGDGPCILLGSQTGCGIVYELSHPTQKGGAWTETILYNFQGGIDGNFPLGDLVFDGRGNLYGATYFGGGKGTTCNPYYGGNCGTVFELSPPKQKRSVWTEKILHSFTGAPDGADPNGGLVLDSKGAVYGTTYYGGDANQECGTVGCGTVFKVGPPAKQGEGWSEKVLHRFNVEDGVYPKAGVIFDESGNLYSTTHFGPQNGYGLIFELKKPSGKSSFWTDTVLYLFKEGDDGAYPDAGLTFDTHGNIYGTATESSTHGGDVFQLKPPKKKRGAWSLAVVRDFTGDPDGADPAASLVLDKDGNLYSTTQQGGTGKSCQGGCGTVFEVSR